MFIKTTIAALSMIAVAGAANAAEFVSNGQTSEVRHGDLKLNTASGQKELDRRIRAAASRVCAVGTLEDRMTCRKLAVANVQAPVAAAIARAETGERYAEAGTDAKTRAVVGN
ncbi:UrcA family protein [Sphingobium fontiphilum]|uniref:UrcA family protein n=1 Tax=Sphingobium fontiphilum TaxID=944425 RepID=A0A7W6DKT8_9SPHN|nr:UrcA family protein [Sphingobium fontiphilum]MBB3980879.1 UrcA family protein [Sphingobium fontiphilum]